MFLGRAQDKIEMEKEGEELGDGLLNGAMRGSLETMSLEEVIRMEVSEKNLVPLRVQMSLRLLMAESDS